MNEIKIEYKLVVFLYAYLHQIDLSLDRSRWVPLIELREYYRTQIAPEKVSNFLLRQLDLEDNRLQNLYFVGDTHLLDKIKDLFFLYFKKETFLKKEEIYYCCQKLLILDQYLKSNFEVDKLEIEKLRIELAKLTYGSIIFKLFAKDRNKAMHVQHFHQNENLNVINIEEFTKGLHI
jgi:hypothetical protein